MAKNSSKLVITLISIAVVVVALGYIFVNSNSGSSANAATTQSKSATTQKSEQPNAASQTAQQLPIAPDFTLRDLNNNEVKLSDYRGKVVFINFWATWCAPCRMEIPYFIELIDKYDKDGFVVLGIAVDPREFNRVPDFVDKMGMNYPVLLDEIGVSNLYGGIRSIPTTFVVNREGRVVYRIVGSRPKQVFEEVITSLL